MLVLLPLLQKLNRIYSGLVLASGEELPFGIVTSAFDGTRMSKWEQPNGAREVDMKREMERKEQEKKKKQKFHLHAGLMQDSM
ncbi:Peptide-N(4)-(N-acetyl-beta-glucosaminyl)asparagine amidase [Camellia lanceoleosa]|uniref:Peptide-N(4)-(N-acetyl-beta-glucosaminyl)asparagine amidase n=1 Tax=Camellia lanceoleosa TaxID=1840588 RepID=A0ACC0FQM5_9ERIC|nr:Peptide-N(4)-(N-acetyl-beta-glucosaminyl)asparagine amidase [Camellia lanceoleosa]